MAKKAPAKKAPAKRKPRPKKPSADAVLPDGQYNSVVWNPELEMFVVVPNPPPKPPAPGQTLGPGEYGSEPKTTPLNWKPWAKRIAASIGLLVLGAAGGVWSAGGIEIGPRPRPADAVSEVFNTQETAFRRLSGERAKALRAGELTTEKASADWMAAKFLPESDAAWATLLTAEAAAFGGEQWTAEKEAATIERYAR